MKNAISFNYSLRFRTLFLLITLIFLGLFLLSVECLIFLLIFLNMLYIYVMYIHPPAISISDGQIHQHSFNSTSMFINKLEEVSVDEKTITFKTFEKKMVVYNFLFEKKARQNLVKFFRLKKLK